MRRYVARLLIRGYLKCSRIAFLLNLPLAVQSLDLQMDLLVIWLQIMLTGGNATIAQLKTELKT